MFTLLLFGLIEFFEQVEELVGNTFILHGAVKCTQARTDIGIGAEPIIRLSVPDPDRLPDRPFFLHHRALTV
jgi:hypothetical protein